MGAYVEGNILYLLPSPTKPLAQCQGHNSIQSQGLACSCLLKFDHQSLSRTRHSTSNTSNCTPVSNLSIVRSTYMHGTFNPGTPGRRCLTPTHAIPTETRAGAKNVVWIVERCLDRRGLYLGRPEIPTPKTTPSVDFARTPGKRYQTAQTNCL